MATSAQGRRLRFLTGQKAIQNGWTFIYCVQAVMIWAPHGTARLYQRVSCSSRMWTLSNPRPTAVETRSQALLDLFDGIGKALEILVVLTTTTGEDQRDGASWKAGRRDRDRRLDTQASRRC